MPVTLPFASSFWTTRRARPSRAVTCKYQRFPELEKVIVSRAEGNAFFIEELLRALLDLGCLTIVNGTAVLSTIDVSIPDTVEGTILARVDRLESLIEPSCSTRR